MLLSVKSCIHETDLNQIYPIISLLKVGSFLFTFDFVTILAAFLNWIKKQIMLTKL